MWGELTAQGGGASSWCHAAAVLGARGRLCGGAVGRWSGSADGVGGVSSPDGGKVG